MNKNIVYTENYDDGYYHFGKDLESYPDAWCYVVWSKRGAGKTYSGLWYAYGHDIKVIYAKRTVEDVNLIASGGDKGENLSPYKPLNRDKNMYIIPDKIQDGLCGFYEGNVEDDSKVGEPIALCMALNKIKTIKGFDASEYDWLLIDEFIPQIGERTSAGMREGDLLLDLYMTVARDRVKRGRKELKLILFANAEEISTPITNTLEIIDDMSEMNEAGESIRYLEQRGIVIHHITEDEVPTSEAEYKSGIYRAMYDTAWGRKAFFGDFTNNDFSNVNRVSLKNMRCLLSVIYKGKEFYIYYNNSGMHYMTDSKQKAPIVFDLSKENDQKKFYDMWWFYLREQCINGRLQFKKYSMYDLLVNYKKYFKV